MISWAVVPPVLHIEEFAVQRQLLKGRPVLQHVQQKAIMVST